MKPLKSVFNRPCWFSQGSPAIYRGIASDSGLVKSHFAAAARGARPPPAAQRWRTTRRAAQSFILIASDRDVRGWSAPSSSARRPIPFKQCNWPRQRRLNRRVPGLPSLSLSLSWNKCRFKANKQGTRSLLASDLLHDT